MLNLEKYSGLPIQIRDDFSLVFGDGLLPVEPTIREFSSMKNYLKDPSATYSGREVYRFYRDIAKPEHLDVVHEFGLQYDITIIQPGKLGEEFTKTAGHYHPFKGGTNIRVPEVYEVLYGRAFFLIQRASPDLERLEEVYLISAERGDKMVLPPGFGHISINPTDDILVLANWQPWKNQGLYDAYEKHNGGAYYVVESQRIGQKGKSTTESFVPNLHYNSLPKLNLVKPRDLPQYNLVRAIPMYFTATKDLSTLDFVANPEKYLDELIPEKLFKP